MWDFLYEAPEGSGTVCVYSELVENGFTGAALGSADGKDFGYSHRISELIYTSDRATTKADPECLRLAK